MTGTVYPFGSWFNVPIRLAQALQPQVEKSENPLNEEAGLAINNPPVPKVVLMKVWKNNRKR